MAGHADEISSVTFPVFRIEDKNGKLVLGQPRVVAGGFVALVPGLVDPKLEKRLPGRLEQRAGGSK